MKIVVCVKQVPDSDAALAVNADKTWIVDSGINFELNPYDRYALEEALRIKEAGEGEVVAVSLGPDRAAQVLKACLATGADRAIHLKDEAFQGGDPWANAQALAAAIRTAKYITPETKRSRANCSFAFSESSPSIFIPLRLKNCYE